MHGARKVLALGSGIRWWLAASLAARFAQAATYLAQAFLLAAVLQHLLSGDGVASQRWRLAAIGALIAVRFGFIWAVEVVAAPRQPGRDPRSARSGRPRRQRP